MINRKHNPVGVAELVLAGTLATTAAIGQEFTPWQFPLPVLEVNTAFNDGCPIEAPDGLHLYIASNRPGTLGGNDIWVAERADLGAPWIPPENLGAPVNSAANDFCPTPLHGKWLFFVSESPGADTCNAQPGRGDIYVTRNNPAKGWEAPEHLGCVAQGAGPNTTGAEFSPSVVETNEGTFLYFSSDAAGTQDIYRSRLGDDGRFGPPAVVPELSTPFDDRMPNISRNGLEIVFSSNRPTWGGGLPAYGGQDVYVARRASTDQPWSDPINLGPGVNTAGSETRASMSWDRLRLYFGRNGDVFSSSRERQ